MLSVSEVPPCLLCGEPTRLLYRSNVPRDAPIAKGELACTSPFLAVHDDIFLCRDCGLARSVPPVDVEEMQNLYRDVEDPDYFASETERRESFRAALERIRSRGVVQAPGRLLEIGSSVGLFLDEARRAGWDAHGIEPSRWAAESAKARGLSVFNGTLQEFAPEGRPFDVVVSWDVWEHLEDPLGALDRAFSLLRPGGLFVFTTVNLGGLGRKIFRGRWPWFMRMHLHYFTRESLTRMVRGAGFEVLSTSTEPKTLRLAYVLDRARSFLGPAASLARSVSERLGIAERPVRIDLGDILLVEARKPESTP
ncbi:MAG: class I SAM-dependent methyltransferase [Vicinamibacteria bacterium]